MAKKKIFSIGFDFPSNSAEYFPFRSDRSLLDADIIVFEPDISCYTSNEYFQGKPLLTESDSFKLVEDSSRWLSELKTAFDSGKTIFIFLSKLQEIYIHTGEKKYSGTGKSRITTNIVDSYDNYQAIPLNLGKIVAKRGKEIKVLMDLKLFATYWKEFASYSVYEVYLEGKFKNPILATKTGNKVVGAVYLGDKGSIILLPPIRYDEYSFITYNKKTHESFWTEEALIFGEKLASCLVEMDKIISSGRKATPPPEWTQHTEYRIENEATLEKKIKAITKNIEELSSNRTELMRQLDQEGKLRRLLYEKGPQLEEAILEALKLLGFEAEQYKNAESEFDAIFISLEGRFLGEAEGKDNKAISIEKLSQLERNLHEDFAREEVTEYAKGVLFGNAYRLQPLSERSEFFTDKCLSGAHRSKIALVRTTDLFYIAQYLKEHNNPSYAKKCREAILQNEGNIVSFPSIPKKIKSRMKKETTSPNNL